MNTLSPFEDKHLHGRVMTAPAQTQITTFSGKALRATTPYKAKDRILPEIAPHAHLVTISGAYVEASDEAVLRERYSRISTLRSAAVVRVISDIIRGCGRPRVLYTQGIIQNR